MTTYQLWRCNDAYAKQALLERWLLIRYRMALNGVESLHVEFAADYAKLADVAVMDRLRLLRDGVDVFGGLLLGLGWAISEAAPAEDVYGVDALSHAIYGDWRTIPRPAGEHFDTVTDHADDVARSFVRRHLGSSAVAARQFADLTVEADAHAAASTTRTWVGGTVLEHLQRLPGIYWRFVPGASGATFTVKAPLWGLDRSAGNGVNDELVLSLDRHNVRAVSYRQDLLSHYNTLYMAGAGEGKDQLTEVRANTTWATAYKRREQWVSVTNLVSAGELQVEGDSQLASPELRPVEELSVEPMPGVITPANLGDVVTVRATRYGRTVSRKGVIAAIEFSIEADGIEYAVPEVIT
jgi:hypothetical protein